MYNLICKKKPNSERTSAGARGVATKIRKVKDDVENLLRILFVRIENISFFSGKYKITLARNGLYSGVLELLLMVF